MPLAVVIAVFGLMLVAILVAITLIDARCQMIPDELNLVLAVAGLGFQWVMIGAFPYVPFLTGAGTLALFWLVRALHAQARGYTGLGLGDVKMAGAGAIWIGPLALPSFVLVASGAGLAFVLIKALWVGKFEPSERTPFGPFLALGLLMTWGAEHVLV
jgi:prepilin signal peptidase PulO-like enzyme (type II secretory pathway)